MNFEHLRIEKIHTVLRYHSSFGKHRANQRKDHIIGININGLDDHNLGYKHLLLEPNSIYFFNQKDNYENITLEEGDCYSIHFTTYEPVETESFCRKVNNSEEIIRRISKIEAAWHSKEKSELILLSEIYELCSILFDIYQAPYAPKDPRITSAKEYIDLHFKEKDCLAIALAQTKLSARRFNDLFKQITSLPPNQYIIGKKIEYAKSLLLLGYLSIAEIAELCGFCDVYYFSRIFKKETGTTPAKFKNNI